MAKDFHGGRFTDWLRVSAELGWTVALAHRFFREVADDAVEDRVFARYLGIEYAFIDSAAIVLGHAVAKAPGFAERRRLAIGLYGLVTDQQDYFAGAFDRLGPDSRRPLSSRQWELSAGLHELFLTTARAAGYEEILACILAAEWMYLTWCRGANRTPSRRGAVRDWVALHAGGSFAEHVDWVRAELDARGPDLTLDRRSQLAGLFARALAAQIAFHDAAYA
jgi:thiaminase (transcriptional activator TenA)